MVDYDDVVENDLNEEYVQLKMAFPKLKKVCDPIAIDPANKSNASNLETTLKTIKRPILQKYSDYVYMPIFIRLSDRANLRPDTICSILDCLKTTLEYVPVDSESQFWKIFSFSLQSIYSSSDDELISGLPEELKLLTVTCLSKLFSNASSDVLKAVYTRKSLDKLNVVIYHVTVLAKREKFVQLRLASLRCLQILLQLRDVKDSSSAWREHVAEVLMLTLPGIVSCAVGVATSTDTLNHKVVVEAVHLWGRMVGLIMEDRGAQSLTPKTYQFDPNSSYSSSETTTPTGPYAPLGEDRPLTAGWLASSGNKLAPVTEKTMTLQQHDHPRVRRQLIAEISHILMVAPKNMHSSTKYLVDGLICLSQDTDPEVRKAGKQALDEFSKSCNRKPSSKKIVEIVEESFHSLVTRLPRVLHGFDLSLKEKQLLLLSGYIDVLGAKHLPGLLNSSSHLNRLLKSLYTAATLDCSIVQLLEEQAVRNLDQEVMGHQKVWKVLKLCDSGPCLAALKEITKKLLKYSESGSIVNSMLDDLQNQPAHRKEILLLLILMFDTNHFISVDSDLSNQVLQSGMALRLWDLPVTISSAEKKPIVQSNVVQICLLCELVGSIAVACGADAFAPNLLTCLYPLLECAGSPLSAVSAAGFQSVGSLANMYGGDIGCLVANNVDYLSYHVTLNLRHAHRNPRVLSVLSVIMNHSTSEVFPPLYEIVKDVLVQSCDTFQEVNANAFLLVFLTFVSRLVVWDKPGVENQATDHSVSSSDPFDEILEFYKNSRIARQYEDPPMESDELENNYNPAESSDESSSKKVPDHIQLTIEILNRSLHFLPSKDISRQIQVLEILEKGVLILSKYKDQLLPMVHKIWSPLVQRFSSHADPIVVHRSFIVLQTLATTSKDFIRNRTSKEVIPFLCKYLTRQAVMTQKEPNLSGHMCQSYKLVRTVLRGLGDVCVCLDLPEEDLETTANAALAFLTSEQPSPLREAAYGTIKTISIKDPNIVWIILTGATGGNFVARSSKLLSFEVERSLSEEDHSNVQVLLAELRR